MNWGVKAELFIDNLLVRIHFIIVTIKWTGLAPWEFEFPFLGSLTSSFLREALSVFLGPALSVLLVLNAPNIGKHLALP